MYIYTKLFTCGLRVQIYKIHIDVYKSVSLEKYKFNNKLLNYIIVVYTLYYTHECICKTVKKVVALSFEIVTSFLFCIVLYVCI